MKANGTQMNARGRAYGKPLPPTMCTEKHRPSAWIHRGSALRLLILAWALAPGAMAAGCGGNGGGDSSGGKADGGGAADVTVDTYTKPTADASADLAQPAVDSGPDTSPPIDSGPYDARIVDTGPD